MEPTLPTAQSVVLINKLNYSPYSFPIFRRAWSRGDVCVIQSPVEPHKAVCKRILHLPGDVIAVPVNQKNSADITQVSKKDYIVPKGHVWVEGDNKEFSHDSRTYGPVPMASLYGKVTFGVWPRPRFISNAIPVTS